MSAISLIEEDVIQAEEFDLSMAPHASNEDIERLEKRMLQSPDFEHADCPLTHQFSPGLYIREVLMKKGIFVIGHTHLTEHFNIVLTGRALVMINGNIQRIQAPCIFKSGAGVRKVLFIEEDMRWATTHVTELTDLAELENALITKSESFKQHLIDMETLKLAIEEEV